MLSVEEMNRKLAQAIEKLSAQYPQFDKSLILAKIEESCKLASLEKLENDIQTRVELMEGTDLQLMGKLCGKLKTDMRKDGILSLGSNVVKRAKGKSNGKTKRFKKQKQKTSD